MPSPAANLDLIRDHNDGLLIAIARATPTFDRASIVAASGLTPQAVSKILARLIEHGLIVPAGIRRQGIGKPANIYELVPTSRYAIGAHVARHTLRLVLVDLTGTVRSSAVTRLPADFAPQHLLHAVVAGIAALVGEHPDSAGRTVGVGIGMVGPLDFANGIVRDAHRLRHWHDIPLRDLAEAAIGLPVHLDKDVTAGVTAAAWRNGTAFTDAALIMVESGIGAGLWLDGRAYRGAHTNAGEFGHTVLQLDGPPCVCGRNGCLEILHDRAAAAGDLPTAARILAAGIVNLLQTVDVDHVVLAGTDLLAHPEVYRTAVEHAIRTEVPHPDWLPVEVLLSGTGADTIAAGAAMQVLDARYGLRMTPGRTPERSGQVAVKMTARPEAAARS